MKPSEDKNTQKTANASAGAFLGVDLSLGMLFGVVMDNIGLGMMFVAIIGLCAAPAAAALKGKNRSEDHDQNDEER